MPRDWKFIFTELFDPQVPLRGEDLRFFVPRMRGPAEEIPRVLQEEPDRALKFFLAGSPGSGKSSELAHLGRQLDDERAVIGLDVYASAANVNQVSGSEVLFMMGMAACRVAEERWGHRVPDSLVQALFEAFRGVCDKPEVVDRDRLLKGTAVFAATAASVLTGGAVPAVVPAAAAAADMASSMLSRGVRPRPFGGLTRELREGDAEVERLASALGEVLQDVALGVRPPLLLVDGLDKIEDTGPMRSLFLQTRLLDLPSCPVVYNGPVALWLSSDFSALTSTGRFQSCPIPNSPVEAPIPNSASLGDEDLRHSRASLREVVRVRLASQQLDLHEVIAPGALDQAITDSGGVVRDLIHLVHRAARLAHRREQSPERIELDLVKEAFDALAREVQPGVANHLRLRELRQVEETGRPSGSEESINLLLRGAILTYLNSRPWFRVHPFLRPLLS